MLRGMQSVSETGNGVKGRRTGGQGWSSKDSHSGGESEDPHLPQHHVSASSGTLF